MDKRKKEIKQLLNSKKGYLKKGKQWLANKYNVPVELISEIFKEVKKTPNIPRMVEMTNAFPVTTEPDKIIRDFDKNQFNSITQPGTYFVTGCVHAPFHNKKMYDAVFNYIRKEVKLRGVILNGDILDMHSISRHNKGRVAIPGVTLDWEYKEANKFLDQIDDLIEDAKVDGLFSVSKYYLFGNHEKWYFTALNDVDTAKYGAALKSPTEALKLSDRGYYVQEDYNKAHINFGKYLEINHGEFVNVHSAKKTIDTYRKSVLYNHTHRFQIYMEGLVGGWNMGWGGDIDAPVFGYATRAMKNSWVNACALVTLDTKGYYHVQPLLYVGDKLIVNGKEH